MNKRYIDFVPGKSTGAKAEVGPRRVAAPRVREPQEVEVALPESYQSAPVRSQARAVRPQARVATTASRVGFSRANSAPKVSVTSRTNSARRLGGSSKGRMQLGVVEDLGENITSVPDNYVEKPVEKSVEKPVEKPVERAPKNAGKTFNVPKSPFINQGKVEKRPLSKNAYQKKVVVPKEEPKGPVTIIAKPEKDAHVSLIVAVILTIILGAAAGTVAFLLLPK